MIAVDTNVLARFYCDDPEAARQRPRARRLMVESRAIFVPLTVVLELEWVMRGFCGLPAGPFCQAIEHLLGMSHVTVERWEAVRDAVDLHRRGLDFADALHWVSSAACTQLVTFDDRFIRRAKRPTRTPPVALPPA